jgi:septum formation protein
MNAPRLVLASASPRRRELLEVIGVDFQVLPVEADESRQPGESPAALARRLARAKAEAASSRVGRDRPVLGADTVVALGEHVFGKPADAAEAVAMLRSLSAREHTVYTAVSVLCGGHREDALSESVVRFKPLSGREIEAYVATGEPMDKAGAYAIQGLGGVFVEHLSGSYSGVMGLPVFETARILDRLGLSVLPPAEASR